jgi:hypothetical protein
VVLAARLSDQALQLGDEALAVVERTPHGYTRARVLYQNTVPHAFRREWPIVEKRAAAAIASAGERGLAMVVAVAGSCWLGRARC